MVTNATPDGPLASRFPTSARSVEVCRSSGPSLNQDKTCRNVSQCRGCGTRLPSLISEQSARTARWPRRSLPMGTSRRPGRISAMKTAGSGRSPVHALTLAGGPRARRPRLAAHPSRRAVKQQCRSTGLTNRERDSKLLQGVLPRRLVRRAHRSVAWAPRSYIPRCVLRASGYTNEEWRLLAQVLESQIAWVPSNALRGCRGSDSTL
jgi:hypothetical protein